MSLTPEVEYDERTTRVANAGGTLAFSFVAFALMIDMLYRGVFRHEAALELMAFISGGGAVSAIYQIRQKAMPPGWKRGWQGAVLLAIIIASFIGCMILAVIDFWPK